MIHLNGKEIDISSIQVDGVDTKDYPDFVDAYICDCYYVDGKQLSEAEIDMLVEKYDTLTYDSVIDSIF